MQIPGCHNVGGGRVNSKLSPGSVKTSQKNHPYGGEIRYLQMHLEKHNGLEPEDYLMATASKMD